ncbi:hypothetical protein V1477_012500 [Vespula maculifrons]|uniref:Uncharacterized protein n=1 Tax=Vespula maculifrons TaxID=7453 RepID=A0ABD2BXN5_VESMC
MGAQSSSTIVSLPTPGTTFSLDINRFFYCLLFFLDVGWPDLLSKVHHQQYPSFFAHSSATLLTAVPARVRQHTSNTSNTSTNTSSNTNANKRVARDFLRWHSSLRGKIIDDQCRPLFLCS